MKVWENKLNELIHYGETEATGKQVITILENKTDLKIWVKWLNSSRKYQVELYNPSDNRHHLGCTNIEKIKNGMNFIGK